MEIQTLNDYAFSVYLNEDELSRRQLDPSLITKQDIDTLLHAAFQQLGQAEQAKTCVELYPGRHELLLFVRFTSESPVYFSFPDLESLLAAVLDMSHNIPATLIKLQDTYILILYPTDPSAVPAFCYEFGTQLNYSDKYCLYLQEHGKTLFVYSAISALQAVFS